MSNEIKSQQLGMSLGKANYNLHRETLYYMCKKTGLDTCFRCGMAIKSLKEFSIDHKKDWMYSSNPVSLFFDQDNIAFSHRKCNGQSRRCNQQTTAGTGAKGVYFNKKSKKNKYMVRVWDNNKNVNIYVGCFDNLLEAAKAYDAKAVEMFGDRAVTNAMMDRLAGK